MFKTMNSDLIVNKYFDALSLPPFVIKQSHSEVYGSHIFNIYLEFFKVGSEIDPHVIKPLSAHFIIPSKPILDDASV